MTRGKIAVASLVMLMVLALSPGLAAAAPVQWPEVIPLPNGFQPEGIVAGRGHTLYAGSLANGAIYQADARTGEGEILAPGQDGRVAAGLDFDQRSGYLFVAGATTGSGYVYDTRTGATVAVFEFTDEPSFVNDVIVTRDAAYFTDTFRGVLYRVPLQKNGQFVSGAPTTEISLGPDFAPQPGIFKANGIVASPNGEWLIVVNTAAGTLHRVDPDTGQVVEIDLGGDAVPSGDGLLLIGQTLYVVQNFLNQISVVQLDGRYTSGTVVDVLTDPDFDIPTTVANIGSSLYAVNARFSTPATPETEYWITRLSR